MLSDNALKDIYSEGYRLSDSAEPNSPVRHRDALRYVSEMVLREAAEETFKLKALQGLVRVTLGNTLRAFAAEYVTARKKKR